MVRTLRAQGAAIILMTTNRVYWSEVLRGLYSRPPYDQTAREGFNRPWLDEYNRIIREVAKRENVSLVDINAAYTGHPDPSSLLLPDRIHPADPGHELVANLLGPVILKTLPPVQ
jgi:lysophospholipase L1-like esterase